MTSEHKRERAIRTSVPFQISLVRRYLADKNCQKVARGLSLQYGFKVTANNVRLRLIKMGLKEKCSKQYHACPSMYDVQRGIKR